MKYVFAITLTKIHTTWHNDGQKVGAQIGKTTSANCHTRLDYPVSPVSSAGNGSGLEWGRGRGMRMWKSGSCGRSGGKVVHLVQKSVRSGRTAKLFALHFQSSPNNATMWRNVLDSQYPRLTPLKPLESQKFGVNFH